MKQFLLTTAAFALLTTIALAQVPSNGEDSLACRSARGEMDVVEPKPGTVSPYVLEKLRQKNNISRQQNQASCDAIKREASERLRQYNIEVAERDRQAKEQAKLYAERRQRQEEAAKAQAVIDAKPINRLYRGYQYYAHVKFCNDVRQGYVIQYVNDVELERADKVIKAIVVRTTAEDTSIDTDNIWKQALQAISGRYAEDAVCKNSLHELFAMSPTPVFAIEKP